MLLPFCGVSRAKNPCRAFSVKRVISFMKIEIIFEIES